jgi:hypothetical protein
MLRWCLAVALIVSAGDAHADEPIRTLPECDLVSDALDAGDLARASIGLPACAAQLPDVAAAYEPVIAKQAAKQGYSPVEVVTDPAGELVVASVARDVPFTAPHKIWLPAGTHELFLMADRTTAIASSLVVVKDGNRAAVLLTRPADAPPPGTSEVDFTDEAAGEMQSGSPEDVEFDSLLPERYRQALGNRRAEGDDGAGGAGAAGYRVAAGLALARADGATATGVMIEARAAYRASRVHVAPEVAVTLARPDDATLAQVHGAVLVELAWLVGGRGGRIALGPGATWITGDGARGGSALGAVATVELVLGRAAVLARGELPVFSSADVRTATFGFGVGLHF